MFNLFKSFDEKKIEGLQREISTYYAKYRSEIDEYLKPVDKETRKLINDLIEHNAIEDDRTSLFRTWGTLPKSEKWELLENTENVKSRMESDIYLNSTIEIIDLIIDYIPKKSKTRNNLTFETPMLGCFSDIRELLDNLIIIFTSENYTAHITYKKINTILNNNLKTLFPSSKNNTSKIVYPLDSAIKDTNKLINSYFRYTPFINFFNNDINFNLNHDIRFEHTHILGGTGHGKTQLLSRFLSHDLERAKKGKGGFSIIDGQGDLIETVLKLDIFNPNKEKNLSEKLIIINPSDTDNPISFNIFDIDFTNFTNQEKEAVLNQSVELYRYIFGSLMGNELTAKQTTMFKFALRLVIEIPNANILTLKKLLEDAPLNEKAENSPFIKHIEKLDPIGQDFFKNHFYKAGGDGFKASKSQVINRLLSVLAVPALSKIFSSTKNKINLFDAINTGKIVLIHTCKDFLQPSESTLFGRLFIAMFTQAALMRAKIKKDDRIPHFLYIDECQDYLDSYSEHLFNQARKYMLGLIVAHQNTTQLDAGLRESINASTSIKFVGGANYKDSSSLAKEMRTEVSFIQDMKKEENQTNFACFVKNQTTHAIKVKVPFGTLENMAEMNNSDYRELLLINNKKYSQLFDEEVKEQEENIIEVHEKASKKEGFKLGKRSAI